MHSQIKFLWKETCVQKIRIALISSLLLGCYANANCEKRAIRLAFNDYQKKSHWGKFFEGADSRLIFRRKGIESHYVVLNTSSPFGGTRGEAAYSVRMFSGDCKLIKLRRF